MTQSEKWTAKYYAQSIADSLNVSAYLESHSEDAAQYHAKQAHEIFAKLADVMGYTIAKKDGE